MCQVSISTRRQIQSIEMAYLIRMQQRILRDILKILMTRRTFHVFFQERSISLLLAMNISKSLVVCVIKLLQFTIGRSPGLLTLSGLCMFSFKFSITLHNILNSLESQFIPVRRLNSVGVSLRVEAFTSKHVLYVNEFFQNGISKKMFIDVCG